MDIVENQSKIDAYRERAKELVAQMTLEEKVEQTVHNAPAIERLGLPAYNWWNEALHGVARAGVATVFPQAKVQHAAGPGGQQHLQGPDLLVPQCEHFQGSQMGQRA